MIVKKNFTCIGRRHLIDVFQKKKGAVSLRCEPNGRTIETVLLDQSQAPFIWMVTEPAYSQGKVEWTPFEFGFSFNWRARRTLIPCEGPIVTLIDYDCFTSSSLIEGGVVLFFFAVEITTHCRPLTYCSKLVSSKTIVRLISPDDKLNVASTRCTSDSNVR